MRFLVVGGGIAGLYNAYVLALKDHTVTVLEKAPNLGGELKTIKYEYNNETYYFDIGPHIPPENYEIWNELSTHIKTVSMPLPIKSSLKIGNIELIHPISIGNLPKKHIFTLFKMGISYLWSKISSRKENNLEDALINAWGKYFYKSYLKYYMTNFWLTEPKNISKSFKGRIQPPRLKNLIKSILKHNNSNKKDKEYNLEKDNGLYLYPEYGMEGVITYLVQELEKLGVEIKCSSEIKKINYSENNILVDITHENKTEQCEFDKMIWSGSIFDLNKHLNLLKTASFRYNDLMIINCAVEKKNILGDKIHTSYIMDKNMDFHRVYEPNKMSNKMAPKDKSSICIEITINKEENDIDLFIKKVIDEFCKKFSISNSNVKYLGHVITKDVYPYLYVDYEEYLGQFHQKLNKEYENIKLIGRLGQYQSLNIGKTLDSIYDEFC